MTIEIVTIPCREDNYAFLMHAPGADGAVLVDAPEAAPVIAALKTRNWTLSGVLITHHHHDHVAGLAELHDIYAPKRVGPRAERSKLPTMDLEVSGGDTLEMAGLTAHVIDVPGHTLGHVAYHIPQTNGVFTADSLMALGCGRLFEGTAAQMWDSLNKLMSLPADTIVCSGHEYTKANGAFAISVDPENSALQERIEQVALAREKGQPTVPSLLSDELATNPFLRANRPELAKAAGLVDATPAEVFAQIRRMKDSF